MTTERPAEPEIIESHPTKILFEVSGEPINPTHTHLKSLPNFSTTIVDDAPPLIYDDIELKAIEERLKTNLTKQCENMLKISQNCDYINRENYNHSAFIGACLLQIIIEDCPFPLSFLYIHIIHEKCMESINFPLRFTFQESFIMNIKQRIYQLTKSTELQSDREFVAHAEHMLETVDYVTPYLVSLYEKTHNMKLL